MPTRPACRAPGDRARCTFPAPGRSGPAVPTPARSLDPLPGTEGKDRGSRPTAWDRVPVCWLEDKIHTPWPWRARRASAGADLAPKAAVQAILRYAAPAHPGAEIRRPAAPGM